MINDLNGWFGEVVVVLFGVRSDEQMVDVTRGEYCGGRHFFFQCLSGTTGGWFTMVLRDHAVQLMELLTEW